MKQSWQEFATNEWDNRAFSWNENSESRWETGSRKDILPFFGKHFNEQAEILDIGCGSGYSSYKLQTANYQVTGMDISEKMIRLAKEQYPGITFQQGDINELPYENEQFDGMLAINVLEWSEVPIRSMKELYRVLRPEGKICIGVLGPTAAPRRNAYDRLYGKQVMMNTMMPWEFAQMAEENGFQVIDHLSVPKKWEAKAEFDHLPIQARQALSFMWVFIVQKNGSEQN